MAGDKEERGRGGLGDERACHNGEVRRKNGGKRKGLCK